MIILLYDARCEFCAQVRNWVESRMRTNICNWIDITTQEAQNLMHTHGHATPLNTCDVSSIVVLKDGQMYTYQHAVSLILKEMQWPWNLCGHLFTHMPKTVGRHLYVWIRNHRTLLSSFLSRFLTP